MGELLLNGIFETMYMTIVSTVISYIIGIPLGVIVYITDTNGICKNRVVNFITGTIINIVRSIPFLILLVAIMPFTRLVVGTSIGSTATIVPLIVAAVPFIARMVESSLKEIDGGIIEAAKAMGSSTLQIVTKVLIPEAKPSLMVGGTIAFATILGYSAMAGFVGGGGLGAIATNYGYYRYHTDVMLITVALLVLIVQIFQEVGLKLVNKVDKRIK
ncbi:MAG: methionine ABC transporter permease [Lachnospiraceae bacterium]|nr:methionine ABC transporter permease [Falcatimonas sp. MSJ-15]MBQ5735747.1 ABC transporter permease [Lachnospiraceae bacterium]MBU5468903.1 ABC transporter permease [Falcatimonas sp. MSJ-15]MEE0958889.1 methionine ABC transporter permease [Lachnospiraceae bacterium]